MTGADRVHVGDLSDLHEDRQTVMVEGTPVGVFEVDGEVYAMENECAHQGGPVCTGKITGRIVQLDGEPGERPVERVTDEMVITCPWHGWEYDIETGRHTGDDSIQLETFEVEIEDGSVYVIP